MKAILDLGTNTFHLLIGEMVDGKPNFLLREYRAVNLGEGGINKKTIEKEAWARALNALREYRAIIDQYPVDVIVALATSAVRNADNGQEFCTEVLRETGINITTIDGKSEAAYIFSGIVLSGCMEGLPGLAVDIGGGSVEFIIGTAKKILYKRSIEIGAARLMDFFFHSDPMTADEIAALEQHLDAYLTDVFSAIAEHKPTYLVGSAGAFETYAEMICLADGTAFHDPEQSRFDFDPKRLEMILEKLIASTHKERENMPGLIPLRVDMIVVASVFCRHLIKKTGIKEARLSTYSLKEGAFQEMFNRAW